MNIRYVLTLCTALVIGGALITGSATAAVARPTRRRRSTTRGSRRKPRSLSLPMVESKGGKSMSRPRRTS